MFISCPSTYHPSPCVSGIPWPAFLHAAVEILISTFIFTCCDPALFVHFWHFLGRHFGNIFFLFTWKPHCGIFLHFSCFSAKSHFWHSSGCIYVYRHFCCVLITWIVYLMSLLKMALLHIWKTNLIAWELYILLSSNTNDFVKSFNCSVWRRLSFTEIMSKISLIFMFSLRHFLAKLIHISQLSSWIDGDL